MNQAVSQVHVDEEVERRGQHRDQENEEDPSQLCRGAFAPVVDDYRGHNGADQAGGSHVGDQKVPQNAEKGGKEQEHLHHQQEDHHGSAPKDDAQQAALALVE